jgi:hypothetical protein
MCRNTKEPDLLTRRPNVKKDVDLANALAYDYSLASQDLLVSSKAYLEVGRVQGT